jgi:eukaryotic-like serine/threonine-protein kinase
MLQGPFGPRTTPLSSTNCGTPNKIIEEIARGGMGVVYLARDRVFGRDVGLKTLQRVPAEGSVATSRFREEARITGQLQHPNIPPVHDLGTLPDGRPYLAMKLIKGRTLEAMIQDRQHPAQDRGKYLAIFEQIAQGVAYAHAHRVVHRDLKPLNVIVGNFGEVQVMDWGLVAGNGQKE